MSSTKLIAVDFGSTHLSAMAGEVLNDGTVRVISEESRVSDDVKWGIVDKPSGASFKVSEIVKSLKVSARMQDVSMVSVAVGAKGMKITPIQVTRYVGVSNIVSELLLNDMHEECRRRFTQGENTVFEVIPAFYLLDGIRTENPVGFTANQITGSFHVVTGSRLIKYELERCFDRTGIMLECNPLMVDAVATAVLEQNEQRVGCALINLGATTTTLAVYHHDTLQNILTLPLGAQNITRDIEELGVSEQHAERLKCLKGSALESLVDQPVYVQIPSVVPGAEPVKISTKFLSTIIEARLEEMLTPLFDYIKRLPYKLEAGIVISGGGAKLNNIIDFITQKTGIYTRIGDHSAWLSSDTSEQYCDPIYAQLIGTIILNNEYRKDHPLEVPLEEVDKKAKPQGKKFTSRISEGFFNFFNDDNKMNS